MQFYAILCGNLQILRNLALEKCATISFRKFKLMSGNIMMIKNRNSSWMRATVARGELELLGGKIVGERACEMRGRQAPCLLDNYF
jgi:hypothetical protein